MSWETMWPPHLSCGCVLCTKWYRRYGLEMDPTLKDNARTKEKAAMTHAVCQVCGERIDDRARVPDHMKLRHQLNDSFVCDSHGHVFGSLAAFKTHWRGAHITEPLPGGLEHVAQAASTPAVKPADPAARAFSDSVARLLADDTRRMIEDLTMKSLYGAPMGPGLTLEDRLRDERLAERTRLAKKAYDNGMTVGWISATFGLSHAAVCTAIGYPVRERAAADQGLVDQASIHAAPSVARAEIARLENNLREAQRQLDEQLKVTRGFQDEIEYVLTATKAGQPRLAKAKRSHLYQAVLDLRQGYDRKNAAAQRAADEAHDLREQLKFLQDEDDEDEDEATEPAHKPEPYHAAVWNAREGAVKVCRMEHGHVVNTIALLKRNAETACEALGKPTSEWRTQVPEPTFSHLTRRLSELQPFKPEQAACTERQVDVKINENSRVVTTTEVWIDDPLRPEQKAQKEAADAWLKAPLPPRYAAGTSPGGVLMFRAPASALPVLLGKPPTVEPDSETVKCDFERARREERVRKIQHVALTAVLAVAAAATVWCSAPALAAGLQHTLEALRAWQAAH